MPPIEPSMTTPSPTTPTTPAPESAPLEAALPSASEGADQIDEEFAFLRTEPAAPAVPAAPAPAAPISPNPAETAAASAPQPVVATPPSGSAAPAAAAPAPAVSPAPAAPQSQEAPQAPSAPQTPEQIHQAYQEHRQQRIQQLAEQTFQLDQATIEGLQTEPEKVIPFLMAQSCMAAMEAVTVAVSNMLPAAIQNVTEQVSTVKKSEEEFFQAWPALNKPEYRATLDQVGPLYRKLNPTASKEDFIKHVGATVMASLGLSVAPAGASAPQLPPGPAPHQPIVASAPRAGAPMAPTNRFAAMIEEDLNGAG